MENVSPASSKGSKHVKILKNKSFMARLSSALLLHHPKHRAAPQNGHHSNDIESSPSYQSTVREPFETIENSGDMKPGYATICDIIQASEESGDEAPPPPPPVPPKRLEDLYSKVNKKKVYLDVGCNTDAVDFMNQDDLLNASVEHVDAVTEQEVENDDQMTTPKKVWNNQTKRCSHRPKSGQEKYSNTIKKIKLFHQGELRHLKHEMKAIIVRNESLKKQVKELLEQEKKWKEEMSIAMMSQQNHLHLMAKNSELNEKISKLEFETKQEVQLLCEKVKLIRKEKDDLLRELSLLSEERDFLQQKCDKMSKDMQNMILLQTHTTEIKKHQKSNQELKQRHEKEVKEWQEKCNKMEEEKNSHSVKIHLLKDEREKLESENFILKERERELNMNKQRQAEHLAKLIEKDHEHYDLVLSMYTLLKDMSAEREVLIKKSQFQDEKQRQLQSAYESQCYKLGQLEQHITGVEEEISNQAQNARRKAQETELNHSQMQKSYEAQLDILRRKVIEKDLVIDNLKKEKKKLELDFENLWLTVLKEKTLSGQKLQRNEITGKVTSKVSEDS